MGTKKKSLSIVLVLVILVTGFFIFVLFNRLPQITYSEDFKDINIQNNRAIPWGLSGNQSIGIVGFGVNNQIGSQAPSPVASTIKILLALSVLNMKPISLNQQGPLIPISSADVMNYTADLALGESVTKIQAGENITEYQALQALLIASANNFAQILSVWAFGSTQNYLSYANNFAKSIGMSSTIVSDASGYSTMTKSNSHDLAILGQLATHNAVISNLVSQYTAIIPVAGKIVNYNSNLNPALSTGIDGIKTGNTTEGGGNYIYSSNFMNYKIVGAIVGATNLNTALAEGPVDLNSYEKLLTIQKIVNTKQIVGTYYVPWMGNINIYSPDAISLPIDPNVKYSTSIVIRPYDKLSTLGPSYIQIIAGQRIFKYTLQYQNTYHSPTFWWKVKYSVKELI